VIDHREFTSAFSSDLIIEKTKVILTNPNKPLFHGPLDPSKFNPYPKNPNIRRFFSAFGWTDEIGSGVRNTYQYLGYYIPDAKPLFIEDELFQTEIPLIAVLISKYEEQILSWLELSDDCKPHLIKGLEQILLDPSSFGTSWPELLLQLVLSWSEKSAKLFHEKVRNLITMTNPDKPNDPEQKYVITEKGKHFLGGRYF